MKPIWETKYSIDPCLNEQELKKKAQLAKQAGLWFKIDENYWTPEEIIRDVHLHQVCEEDLKMVDPKKTVRNAHAHMAKLSVQLADFEKRVKEYFK